MMLYHLYLLLLWISFCLKLNQGAKVKGFPVLKQSKFNFKRKKFFGFLLVRIILSMEINPKIIPFFIIPT
jgi:hypothetical protein